MTSDLQQLYSSAGSMDTPLKTTEIHKQNDYYGHAAILKQFAGIPQEHSLKCSIEHAPKFGEFTWDVDLKAAMPAFYVCSDYRFRALKKRTSKALFALGPYIKYAPVLLSPKEIENERARLGTNLLVFPAHSTHWVQSSYDIEQYCRFLSELAGDFDTVRVCLYWKDILLGRAEPYRRCGFECVTAGHMYDSAFLSRLRTIIATASIATANRLGTHTGYCVLEGKPFFISNDESVEFSAPSAEILKRDLGDGSLDPRYHELRRLLRKQEMDIDHRAREIIEYYWGAHNLRSVEQVREIIQLTEDMYERKPHFFLSSRNVMRDQVEFYGKQGQYERSNVLLRYDQSLKASGIPLPKSLGQSANRSDAPQSVGKHRSGETSGVFVEEVLTEIGESNPDGIYERAIALGRSFRLEEARAVLKELVLNDPTSMKARDLLRELTALHQNGLSGSEESACQADKQVPHARSGNLVSWSNDFYGKVPLNPKTLARISESQEIWDEILAFHGMLATDEYVKYVDAWYRECRRRFGRHWRYLDIVNVLYTSAKEIQPQNYLEIGVRRGRSACTVARGFPAVNIYAFDLWQANYAGMENSGSDFVRRELTAHGHRGKIRFIDGNSHETIPRFLMENSGLEFSLITVDGDHTEAGALNDLTNVAPRLALGGVLVFDDIAHPQHPYLLDVWHKFLSTQPSWRGYEFVDAGYGVAFAIRMS